MKNRIKQTLLRIMIIAGIVTPITGVAQEPTDERVNELKTAFEEITESFRQRMQELEEKGEAERNIVLSERDNAIKERDQAIAERDAERTNVARLEQTITSLETKLDELTVAMTDIRSVQSDKDDALAAKDAEIARLQEALNEAQEANSRERFALAYNLGTIYKAARQYERAESQFLKAAEMNPDDAALHYNLGILYDDNLNKPKKARQHYERFLELAPNDPDVPNVVKWLSEL